MQSHCFYTNRCAQAIKITEKMIFKGVDNQSVEIRVTNYQFPKTLDCQYDSNWLLIYLNVKSKCGNWKTTDPSLLVSNVKRIIGWFNKLSVNEENETNLSFLEPNLEFDLIKITTDLKTVRIIFNLESRPQNADDEKDYFVDCEMDNRALKQVAEELTKEIEPFPERAIG